MGKVDKLLITRGFLLGGKGVICANTERFCPLARQPSQNVDLETGDRKDKEIFIININLITNISRET
jgi:hypothetical protein